MDKSKNIKNIFNKLCDEKLTVSVPIIENNIITNVDVLIISPKMVNAFVEYCEKNT